MLVQVWRRFLFIEKKTLRMQKSCISRVRSHIFEPDCNAREGEKSFKSCGASDVLLLKSVFYE